MTNGIDALAFQLQAMSPQQRRQLTGLGTMDERSDLLKQQLQQALQLQQQAPAQHTSTTGSILGGLGSVLGAVRGAQQQQQAMQGLQGVLNAKDAGRGTFNDLLIQALMRRQQEAGSAITRLGNPASVPMMLGGGG